MMIILQVCSPERRVICCRSGIAHSSVALPLVDEEVTDGANDADAADEFDEEPVIQAVSAGSGVVNGAQEPDLLQQAGKTGSRHHSRRDTVALSIGGHYQHWRSRRQRHGRQTLVYACWGIRPKTTRR
jgi:hypothetical protein